jgi:hypothetical protein
LASRVEEPGAGKKNSGPAWAHNALSCQESSSSVVGVVMVVLIGMGTTLPMADKHRLNEASTTDGPSPLPPILPARPARPHGGAPGCFPARAIALRHGSGIRQDHRP